MRIWRRKRKRRILPAKMHEIYNSKSKISRRGRSRRDENREAIREYKVYQVYTRLYQRNESLRFLKNRQKNYTSLELGSRKNREIERLEKKQKCIN